MKLTDDMRRVVNEQRLGFVATVTPDGRPNVSPKGTTIVLDETRLLFADVASPNTIANLATNPEVEINIVDPIVRKGYRFRGTATVHPRNDSDDDTYARGMALLVAGGSSLTEDRVRSIVVVEVLDGDELISPAYDDPTATEESVAASQLAKVTQLHDDRFSRHEADAGPGPENAS